MAQGACSVHRSCVPLDEVDLRTPEERGQLTLALGDGDADGDGGDWCQR